MCYMLYLGSDGPLPVSKFDTQHPAFYISDTDDTIKRVEKFFTKKHVYYAGSSTDCGCDFFYNLQDDPDEYKNKKDCVVSLVETIKEALKNSETVELLVTWAGKESTEPTTTHKMSPDQLIGDEFPLDEFHFVVFSLGKD